MTMQIVDDDDDTDDEDIDNDYHIENEEACFVYGTQASLTPHNHTPLHCRRKLMVSKSKPIPCTNMVSHKYFHTFLAEGERLCKLHNLHLHSHPWHPLGGKSQCFIILYNCQGSTRFVKNVVTDLLLTINVTHHFFCFSHLRWSPQSAG